jgi:esterase
MKLFYRQYGENGSPLVILHGLFGQSDNWTSLARLWSDTYSVYVIDQRNHGQSPHAEEFNYPAMAEDLRETLDSLGLNNIYLLGHSMGGKTAMFFALKYPERIKRMLVADIGPRFYKPHHTEIIAGLQAVQPETLSSRAEAEERLSQHVPEASTRQFLLKNLYRTEDNKFAFRFNLKAISTQIEHIGKAVPPEICQVDTLFVRGENSRYILPEDWSAIQAQFPHANLASIAGAGHWLHAEKPQEFSRLVMNWFS